VSALRPAPLCRLVLHQHTARTPPARPPSQSRPPLPPSRLPPLSAQANRHNSVTLVQRNNSNGDRDNNSTSQWITRACYALFNCSLVRPMSSGGSQSYFGINFHRMKGCRGSATGRSYFTTFDLLSVPCYLFIYLFCVPLRVVWSIQPLERKLKVLARSAAQCRND